MASSRGWEGGSTGVEFWEVGKSVHEERLEEMKVFGVLLLLPNLSAIGC